MLTRFTSYQQDTPFYNLFGKEITEIRVTDPKHPLFNRSFQVLSFVDSHLTQGYVRVIYREHVPMRIPITATDLASNFCTTVTKLTRSSIEELVFLAQECNVCPINPMESGNSYPRKDKQKLSSNFR